MTPRPYPDTPAPRAIEENIYRSIKAVILSGRLSPGTRLPETRIAPLFGVTRERLRKVLHRLGHEHLLRIVPNVGAVVPAPSLDRARELFDARRVLEAGIGACLCERITDDDIRRLERHVDEEEDIAAAGDRPRFILASSQFHQTLAGLLDNPLVSAQLDELLAKSALFSAFHDPEHGSACSCREHRRIVDSLARRDIADVHEAVVAHQSLIETRLRPVPPDAPRTDAVTALRAHLATEPIRP